MAGSAGARGRVRITHRGNAGDARTRARAASRSSRPCRHRAASTRVCASAGARIHTSVHATASGTGAGARVFADRHACPSDRAQLSAGSAVDAASRCDTEHCGRTTWRPSSRIVEAERSATPAARRQTSGYGVRYLFVSADARCRRSRAADALPVEAGRRCGSGNGRRNRRRTHLPASPRPAP